MSGQRGVCRRVTRREVVRSGAAAGLGVSLLGMGGARTLARRPAARAQNEYTIAFIQGVIADNFYITMDCGARAKAAEIGGVTIDTQGPERFLPDLQTPILNAVVQTRPDAIMMAPVNAQQMIAPIQAAIDAGVPVLCVDTTINSDIQLADVATDNVEGGRLAARGLAEAIGGQGKVFVVNVIPGISTTDMREQGFREEIANYPDIEYVGQEYCNDDINVAAQVTALMSSLQYSWPTYSISG
jgi:ribose transport system substrate-binding protein